MSNIPHRKEREKQQHYEEILAAAEKLFSEKGFHRTTVEEVAELAEFSVGSLYNFFPGKEQLYQSLIQQRCQMLADEVDAALKTIGDPVKAIRAYIELKTQLCYKYESFVRLYARERLGDRFANNELWREIVAPVYEKVLGGLAEIFRSGIKQGCFRADLDPVDMTIALDGLTDGFLYAWLEYPEKSSFRDKLETMIRLFFYGVQP